MHPVSIWPPKTARNEDLLLDVTTSRNAVINIVNVANKEFKQPRVHVALALHRGEHSGFLTFHTRVRYVPLPQPNLASYK